MKNIPFLDGYKVDSLGRVWSGKKGRFNRWKGLHLIRQWTDPNGYNHVTLRATGERKRYCVHVLVAAAYMGPRPSGFVCAHINGDPGDNRPENLKYVTQEENIAHKSLHGTSPIGERSHLAKLTELEAIEVIRLCAEGRMSFRDIGRKFNLHEATVHSIRTGRTWKHLQRASPATKDDQKPIAFLGDAMPTEMRDVPGFPSYRSDFSGNVWSFFDGHPNRWPVPHKILPHVQRDGYLEVRIRHPNGKYSQVTVHRLVAMAWLGERPSGYVVHHKNGKRKDNRVRNLEYVTTLQNVLHKHRHGTMARGSRLASAKLTEDQAREVLRMALDGELTLIAIGRRFGIGPTAVWSIRTGRSWKHLH